MIVSTCGGGGLCVCVCVSEIWGAGTAQGENYEGCGTLPKAVRGWALQWQRVQISLRFLTSVTGQAGAHSSTA